MKKILFILAILLPCTLSAQKARIEFQETSYNFGYINETAGKTAHIFTFKNVGQVPLIITNVRTGCGCTVPEWENRPIAPGASGSIKVYFDPLNQSGNFIKGITVNSNASNPVVTLVVRGRVKPQPNHALYQYKYQINDVKFTHDHLHFGSLTSNERAEQQLVYINHGEQKVTLTATSSSPAISVRAIPEILRKGESGILYVQYNASLKNDWGFITDAINISINQQHHGKIKIFGNICEDFSHYQGNFTNAPAIQLDEKDVVLERIPMGSRQTHAFYIHNIGKSDLIIRKINTSDDKTTVDIAKNIIKPGKKTKVMITYTAPQMPKSTQIIQFITNAPTQSVIDYKLTIETI